MPDLPEFPFSFSPPVSSLKPNLFGGSPQRNE
jgi:hypothetical protein